MTIILYGNPICANCQFFNWPDEVRNDDTGPCSELGIDVDGNANACERFIYSPAH